MAAEEKKNGFFGRLGKRLSNAFKKNQKTEEAPAIGGNTAIKPPTEEKSVVSARPIIRSETTTRTEPSFAIAPAAPVFAERKPKPIPQPKPIFKEIVRTAPKPVPKKKKRKRYPNEKSLKRVFKVGQYLSRVRQRRHKTRKGLNAKAAAKKLKIRIKKSKKKTVLTKKAVKLLQQEMQTLSPRAPLSEEEKEPLAPQFLPGVTIKEETKPVSKEENNWGASIEKKETEPETRTMVSVEFPRNEPVEKKPEEWISPAILSERTPIKQARIEKPELKPSQKETAEKEKSLEAEIKAEIRKQREIPEKKPTEAKKAAVSIGEKTKPARPKEAIFPSKKETRPAKDEIAELQELIAEKFGGKVAPQQIQELQQKVRELLEQKMVTKSKMEENIRMVDANRLLDGFTKLLSLIELNEEPEQPLEMPSTIGPQQKPEKFAGTERELEKKELITDFDKILEIVRERGTITLNELASELDIDKRLLKEAVDILEENNLVIQEYPAFGSPRIIDPAYLEKKGKKSEKE